MAESAFTFRVDDELKSAFAAVAGAQERTSAQLLRVFMRDAVQRSQEAQEHAAWFRDEVERAVGEADDSGVARTPHGQVRSSWRQQRTELERRAAEGTA